MKPGTYAKVARKWKKGDRIELDLPMRVRLVEANPLVEEARNQVAVEYGPVVYCLEAKDIPAGIRLSQIKLPADNGLKPVHLNIDRTDILALAGTGLAFDEDSWQGTLYREIRDKAGRPVQIRLIPYYAWGNRGKADMNVWIPFTR